jgi:hypothetical protein
LLWGIAVSVQSSQVRSSCSSRLGARALILALAAVVPAAAALGCSDDASTLPPAAVPTITAVDAQPIAPPKNDAGELLGGCCSFTVGVTYPPLPNDEFIREAYVQWALLGTARFNYPASDASVAADGNKAVSFTVEVPSLLAAPGAKLAFTVVIVTGRGEKSTAAGGTLIIN